MIFSFRLLYIYRVDLRKKILDLNTLKHRIVSWKMKGDRIVFTNGCFDIIHEGHLHLLREAKQLGDRLVVGLNNDNSVKRLKGSDRPVKNEQIRAELLASLTYVDAVTLFEEDTPEALIQTIEIDVLTKGGDYQKSEIVGNDFVETNGGEVVMIPFKKGHSSTQLINKISNKE